MTPESRRRRTLLLVLLALAGLVALRYTVFAPGDAEAASDEIELSAFDRFTTETSTLAANRALLENAERIAAARAEAASAMRGLEPMLVTAETRALAFAELRTAVLRVLEQAGVRSANVREGASPRPGADDKSQPAVVPLPVTIDFNAADESTAFAAIAAINALERPALRLTGLRVEGPGFVAANRRLQVTLTATAGARIGAAQSATGATP